MKTKELYNAPEMEQIVLRLDKSVLVVSDGANWGDNSGTPGGNDGYVEGDF